MKTILLLEDLPRIRLWLHGLAKQVFPDAVVHEADSVKSALALVDAHPIDLALLDLGLPDGSGVTVVSALRERQPGAVSVIVTIHDDDEFLFPALQAGAQGYVLKDQSSGRLLEQLARLVQGEPALTPSIARKVMAWFSSTTAPQQDSILPDVQLTDRERDVLLRVGKGYTLPEIATQLNLSRHTVADYVKQIYRKLNVSSRAEAALEAQRLGLFNAPRH
ncbi:response regulator [Amphibiibacter pelophylacis]|uniref:Response regulator transcription factor n=1 Tax=Amphibiibacter pelophylacis TaxID=1799477 RepID=A0ACC6P2A5_9BURK